MILSKYECIRKIEFLPGPITLRRISQTDEFDGDWSTFLDGRRFLQFNFKKLF